MLVGTDRHALVRQVGHGQQQHLQLGLNLLETGSGAFQLHFVASHLSHYCIGLGLPGRALGFELANLFA